MPKKRIDPRDFVLAIVAYSPEKTVQGRTFLQKLAYFLNEMLGLGVKFEPYYYGPYSESIATATDTLVTLDFLNEIEERFPATARDIFEPRRYTYQLSKAGNKVLTEIRRSNPRLFNKVSKAMDIITSTEHCNYECLSLAAKMLHILDSQNKPMTDSELSIAAQELGWELDEDDIEMAASFLRELGLIKDVS